MLVRPRTKRLLHSSISNIFTNEGWGSSLLCNIKFRSFISSIVALSEILTNILDELNRQITYLIIDALDECTTDLGRLLELVIQTSSAHSRVKWIVSSRNWLAIEKDLDTATQKIKLCLELNEASVSAAITTHIQHRVDWSAKRNKYGDTTLDAVQRYFSSRDMVIKGVS